MAAEHAGEAHQMGNESVGVLRLNKRVLLYIPSVHGEGEAGARTWTWPSCCRRSGEAVLRTWLPRVDSAYFLVCSLSRFEFTS